RKPVKRDRCRVHERVLLEKLPRHSMLVGIAGARPSPALRAKTRRDDQKSEKTEAATQHRTHNDRRTDSLNQAVAAASRYSGAQPSLFRNKRTQRIFFVSVRKNR